MNALRWYGGKVLQYKWINGILGPNRQHYVEPFFGMGSVLLNRKPSRYECVSDINDRVVNWWKVLQTQTDALAEAITTTPVARSIFNTAARELDIGSPLERAAALTTVIMQGRMSGDSDEKMYWAPACCTSQLSLGFTETLHQVALRMRKVAIDNKCATYIMRRYKNRPRSIMYCDPPYWDVSDNRAYSNNQKVDLTDLLLAQQGRVAISGYGDQWDHLGWKRYEKAGFAQVNAGKKRTDVVWCNEL